MLSLDQATVSASRTVRGKVDSHVTETANYWSACQDFTFTFPDDVARSSGTSRPDARLHLTILTTFLFKKKKKPQSTPQMNNWSSAHLSKRANKELTCNDNKKDGVGAKGDSLKHKQTTLLTTIWHQLLPLILSHVDTACLYVCLYVCMLSCVLQLTMRECEKRSVHLSDVR